MSLSNGMPVKAWVMRFVDLCQEGTSRIDAYVVAKGMERADIVPDTYSKAARTWASKGAVTYRAILAEAEGGMPVEIFKETPVTEVFVERQDESDEDDGQHTRVIYGKNRYLLLFQGIAFDRNTKDKDRIAAAALVMKYLSYDVPEKQADGKELAEAAAILALPDTTVFVPKHKHEEGEGITPGSDSSHGTNS